jgi:ribosomal protein L7/L12
MPHCTFCLKSIPTNSDRCPHCGAWLSQTDGSERSELPTAEPIDEAFEFEIRSLLSRNQKIEAIKIYRERTGVGLAEAKYAVEQLQRGGNLMNQPPASDDVDPQLLELLMAGEKIKAIKLYREKTKLGLKESKEAVEALAARHGNRTAASGLLWRAGRNHCRWNGRAILRLDAG